MWVVDSKDRVINNSQVIQSYGIDSLVGVSPAVADIREFQMRQSDEGRLCFKILKHHPSESEPETGSGLITRQEASRLFGKNAENVWKHLINRGYCRTLTEESCILTWRFRNISADDFDIGLGSTANKDVYRILESLLWEDLPEAEGVDFFVSSLLGKGTASDGNLPFYEISKTEYWFRQGIDLIVINFSSVPSDELLLLLDQKLQMIQQEKMQNYFHIIASFNADPSMWMNEKDRTRRFFEIIEQLLMYTWRPFDIETCEVSIEAAGDEGLIASGSLRLHFTESGLASVQFDQIGKRFPPVASGGMEFTVNDVALRVAETNEVGESSFLSMRMVSRSAGNVDPRQNLLTHRFVKLFIETVGKLIDVIMPVIRREEALRNLRWRYFLDSMRLRALEYGEDLHRIVTDSLIVMKKFFRISGVLVYSEDRELDHMLALFSRNDEKERLYTILEQPLSPADILRKQLVVFPIREIPGGRVLIYFKLPLIGKKPLNPEIPDQYLTGTELWNGVNEEALLLGITDLKDYLFFMATECLTTNPKAVLANLNRRLPVRGGMDDIDSVMKLSRRVLERYSRFFDLFATLAGNMESGLAYMRGRRDNLTGLYNRQHFNTLLHEVFMQPGVKLGIMFIDMDNFKIFNDAVSHDFGDKLLISLANRMIDFATPLAELGVPGRFGGDEFCFYLVNAEASEFEGVSIKLFKAITQRPLVVSFFFDDRSEGAGMEINLMSFLHRLMRPDVGSRQASRSEFIERPNVTPREHVIDIWKHYRQSEGNNSDMHSSVKGETIISEISSQIEDKILYNKIFPEIDEEFRRIIKTFITLQLKDYSTNRIRDNLIDGFGALSIERNITIKVSAGLAHNSENRLRSMESLFKAADGRTYLAKHNGRNCLFGLDGVCLS